MRLSRQPDWRHVFGAPLVIAAISGFGFVAAFLFGEAGQWLSWAALGSPIAVIVWVIVRKLSAQRSEVDSRS
jgi:uncharacterized BrkB/YihY/UPF0761 family membrane protein